MQFNVLDTENIYRRLLTAPNTHERHTIFCDELVEPFAGLASIFGGGDPMAMFAQWKMTPEDFAPERRSAMMERVDKLAAGDAFNRAAVALERGYAAFGAYHHRIRHGAITFGLLLCDLSGIPMAQGYSGFGSIPGWIMTLYDTPTPENLKRVEGCTVHELHHNLAAGSDSGINFNMMTITVGEYMVMEGLAEAFAAELYGEDSVGPWVTAFDESRLETVKSIFKNALHLTGFGVVRSYIFGDEIAEMQGLQPVGVPYCAGYALGYRLVRQYLAQTGKSAVEATYTPAATIIEESGFFAD
jgi:uncharacterized protein YjaZ